MMRLNALLVCSALLASNLPNLSAQQWDNVAALGGSLPSKPTIQLVKIAEGFNDPVSVSAPNDGSGRLFVVERVGRIKVVKDGKVQAEPFLDLTGATRPLGGEVQTQFIEQGLYSVAFHPNFKANGYFYVHYASLPFNGDGFIVRFTAAKDGVKADPESAKVIYIIDQPWYNHNGGQIAFGPDGMLYIGSGDGGWEGDPLDAGQRLDTDLGKILRIDVNVPETQIQAYNVPQDNPFIWRPQLMALFGVTDKTFASLHPTAKPEIWAYGVRNPWMFSFDNKTGDLYIADVGQSEMEAIYFQPRSSKGGENYGWKDRFGTKCFPMDTTGCAKVGAPPAAEYSHKAGGCAVMGFGVSRSAQQPKLDGIYFAGDWCTGKVFGLGKDNQGKWQLQEMGAYGFNFTGGGQDEKGNVYAVNCHCQYTTDKGALGNPPGELYQVVQADLVPAGAAVAPKK